MRIKRIIAGVLLLFVVASVGYMAVRDRVEQRPEGTQTGAASASVPTRRDGGRLESGIAPAPDEPKFSPVVIAYYFRGEKRCATCLKLEAYAKDALDRHFDDAMKSGRIAWRVVNVERPGNSHFVNDFQLVTKSVVLVSMKDGRQAEWRNLERIWELVGDKSAYIEYVRQNVADMLQIGS